MDYQNLIDLGIKKIKTDPLGAFKNISNAQRFVSKNILRDPRPIRYLERGELHLPNHAFSGPQTNLNKYRDYPPYNNIDACSKEHDLDYEEAFSLPEGEERRKLIREADDEVMDCYDRFKNEDGYRIAKLGINLKTKVEDVSPALFNMIIGESYRGSQEGKGQNGGSQGDLMTPFIYAMGMGALPLMYGEYKLIKTVYDKTKKKKKEGVVVDSEN
jgi:hypothetical protein